MMKCFNDVFSNFVDSNVSVDKPVISFKPIALNTLQ